jgi:hypothetical protein
MCADAHAGNDAERGAMMCRAERLETIADVRELAQVPENDASA